MDGEVRVVLQHIIGATFEIMAPNDKEDVAPNVGATAPFTDVAMDEEVRAVLQRTTKSLHSPPVMQASC